MILRPSEIDQGRRKFLTVATGGTAAVGVVLAAVPFVESWEPSERARALGAPVEVDLSKLRDRSDDHADLAHCRSIYVVRRARRLVDKLPKNDDELKDPKSEDSIQPDYARNEMRSRRAECWC